MNKTSIFHSIRWRLVASYVLLTLLTVSLVGILAVSLVKQYVEHQQQTHLTANAEAIAQQVLPLLWPLRREFELFELTRTSAFLGNVRVRILDKNKHLISDSGPQTDAHELLFISPSTELESDLFDQDVLSFIIVPEAHKADTAFFFADERATLATLSKKPTMIRQIHGPWGNRLIFEDHTVISEHDFLIPSDVAKTIEFREISTKDTTLWVEEPPPRSDRIVIVPIGDQQNPLAYVELSNGPDSGVEAITTTRQAFLWAALGATIIAVWVGLFVSRGLTAPIHNLTHTADQMSNGDLSVRASVRGRGEIGQLAHQFNHMAARLETSFIELATERDTLRRFIADASHELRTPLTTLKNFNELLQGPARQDLAAQQEFLAESQAQLNRLEWITHNLLNLSRLEAGLVELDRAEHDVGEILATLHAAFKTVAQEKEITLTIKHPPTPIGLTCDRTRLEMALSNLIDNALKFTPATGQVTLGAEQNEQTIKFWVKDNGCGIHPLDHPRLFERFYRGQNTHQITGSGLGLAIVHTVVQAHKGQITLESTPNKGTCFRLELPV